MENQTEPMAAAAVGNKKGINIAEILKSKTARNIIFVLIILALIVGGYFIYQGSRQIYTDKAEISAPSIILGPEQPGVLRELLVKNGDHVSAQEVVARFDNGLVRAKTDGTIVDTDNEIGKFFSPGIAVVTMINPDDLRVVAHIAENKGLSSVRVGQNVTFNVDAFGSKKFYGTVEEIAKTSDQSSVVFSISDKRIEAEFSVKIKYDRYNYPELLNGMSAKVWIYK